MVWYVKMCERLEGETTEFRSMEINIKLILVVDDSDLSPQRFNALKNITIIITIEHQTRLPFVKKHLADIYLKENLQGYYFK